MCFCKILCFIIILIAALIIFLGLYYQESISKLYHKIISYKEENSVNKKNTF